MDKLYNFLYNLNDGVVLAITVVSAIGSLISGTAFFLDDKIENSKKWFSFIACIFILALMVFTKFLVKVPNVVGTLYIDARNELRENDLKYNVIKDEDQSIVKKQGIKAGTIVRKGTKVKLTLESDPEEKEKNKTEVLDELRQKNVRFVDLSLQFSDLRVQLMDQDNEVQGNVLAEITNCEIKELRLVSEQYGIEFADYNIISGNDIVYKNSYVINDVPVGEYWLEVSIDGYERFFGEFPIKTDMLTSPNMFSCTIYLNKIDATAMYPFTIRFVNSSYEDTYVNSYSVSYNGGIPTGGEQNVNNVFLNAHIGDTIAISVDTSVEELEIHLQVPGEICVMVNNDGSLKQIDYVEWLNGISG